MSLRIATNVQALAAQRNLNINNEKSAGSLERLSSGSRINKAGDDAAGLAISEKLKANIRSMKQATRNANDGISLVQTAADTIGQTERGFVDKEVQALKSEIDRISNVTEFNGTKLLNGTSEPLDIQVGLTNDPMLDRFVFDTPTRVTTLGALGLSEVSTQNKATAQANLQSVDNAIVLLNENRSSLGALQNRLMSTINNMSIYRENLEGANSRIRDTDMAEETSELVKNNILTQANVSVLGQANQMPNLVMKLLG